MVNPPPTSRQRRERGFSIVETMIAAALLLFIALGILPLFAQAIVANRSGRDSSTVANHARSRLELFEQLQLSDPLLEIQVGDERRYDEWYSKKNDAWIAGAAPSPVPSDDEVLWTRETVIRQFNATDLENPLNAGADPGQVHVKEIEVTVRTARGAGHMFADKGVSLRVYKSE